VNAVLAVPNPRLWNGRADPYLYTVRVELRRGATELDAVTQPLGIRSFRVDANAGFFLNGRHVRLYGVSRHQDRAGKGWALSPADHEEDMALIAELGANAVRFAHYQHAPEWFELADRYGMLVWAEVPFVNEANFTLDEPTPALIANARQQLLEQIRQNHNHPAVFAWSVGNEIDIGNFMRNRRAGQSLSLLRNLHELAKSDDPNRLTAFADCCETPPMQVPGAEPLAGTTDLIGYNRYFGWYYGKSVDFGATLDTFHQRHPTLPIGISEYGAGAALSQHTDNPLGGVVDMLGRPHPEEVQNRYHELTWPQIQARPFVWGSFIWNMFDFSSDLREEGDAIDINDKGLVTYDRKTRKDAFFYYKAQWSNEPVVHIAGGRYVERPYAVTDVRVYSNAPSIRLVRNASDLGTSTCDAGVCVWREVGLEAGANTFTASAGFAGKTVAHSVRWNGPDAARGVRIDSGDLAGHRAPDGQLVGSDNFFDGGDAKRLNGLSIGGFGNREPSKRKTVAGAKDPVLYEGYREGSFSYDIPLPNGAWNVTVHSFESVARLAQTRTFNVVANGRMELKAWSPGQVAGEAFKAAEASFRIRVSDGRLRLRFEPVGGAALIAAITISP
jgi:beta-galactosidase